MVLLCLLSLLRLCLLLPCRAGLTSLRPRSLHSIRNLGSTTILNHSGFANIPDPHRDGSGEGCFAGTLARRHDLTTSFSRWKYRLAGGGLNLNTGLGAVLKPQDYRPVPIGELNQNQELGELFLSVALLTTVTTRTVLTCSTPCCRVACRYVDTFVQPIDR